MGNIVTVFQSQEGEIFRIPALYYNNNEKKLFAFAEKRTTADDATSVALVMRTGIVDIDTATKKKMLKMLEVDEVVGVTEINNSTCHPNNPCIVYEANTQTLFLFFIYVNKIENYQNAAHLCYVQKKICDDKWSGYTDLSDLLPTDGWSTFAIGPGHGIQTESGRMIVPGYAYTKEDNIPHSFYIYSDDKGSTWYYGTMLCEPSGQCQMAEIYDSKGHSLIYCNARSQGEYRVQAEINNCGFNSITPVTPLVETGGGCEGSVISFPAQSGEPNTKWLLYSHPTNPKERLDLGVYRNNSPLNSNENCSGAWSQPWVINKGPSGYSDLTYIEDGWFACLMERGEKTYTEEIACFLFYDDLILQI